MSSVVDPKVTEARRPQAAGGTVIPIQPVAAEPQTELEAMYARRKEIYPRSRIGDSLGLFQKWRWAFVWATQIVFYGLPWLTWNGRQAVLFDLAARKFYIFGLVLWPQDIIYLSAILIISALSLFLFTAVGGRLWCGYACPQTVYTEIFMWIERRIEGDRARRMKLDQAPWTAGKAARKFAKHTAWIALALWTGYTFVGFFTPIRDLGAEFIAFTFGGWSLFWVVFYGFATYGNAGWMREQVCKYMCPYARFQSAMFDKDTLIVTYDTQRGEPRGARSKAKGKAAGLGDCVDCGLCVQVCPTGIDIRNGLQYECIGCAACIDACDHVMDKAGLPRGLVRYATTNSLTEHYSREGIVKRIFRPRVIVYSGILLAVIAALVVAVYVRVPLKVDVIRDRAALAREVMDEKGLPRVENVYRLVVMNTTEKGQSYTVRVSGLPGLVIASEAAFDVPPASSMSVPLRVQAPIDDVPAGSHKIAIEVQAQSDGALRVNETTTFLGLRR
jgi:cytochrome c oxidase accessory protein FixG